jgi:hypothetical protein
MWWREYGNANLNLPYFRASEFAEDQDTNSPAGLQFIGKNRFRYFMRMSTPTLNGPGKERFVSVVKAVLKKCRG